MLYIFHHFPTKFCNLTDFISFTLMYSRFWLVNSPANWLHANIDQQWRSWPDDLIPLCKFQVIVIMHFFKNWLFSQSVSCKYLQSGTKSSGWLCYCRSAVNNWCKYFIEHAHFENSSLASIKNIFFSKCQHGSFCWVIRKRIVHYAGRKGCRKHQKSN